jgi:hypothetical protein
VLTHGLLALVTAAADADVGQSVQLVACRVDCCLGTGWLIVWRDPQRSAAAGAQVQLGAIHAAGGVAQQQLDG